MAAMRAGVTHWQAGQIDVAHGMICKAFAIIMITHGPTHPITKDLEVSGYKNFFIFTVVTSMWNEPQMSLDKQEGVKHNSK